MTILLPLIALVLFIVLWALFGKGGRIAGKEDEDSSEKLSPSKAADHGCNSVFEFQWNRAK